MTKNPTDYFFTEIKQVIEPVTDPTLRSEEHQRAIQRIARQLEDDMVRSILTGEATTSTVPSEPPPDLGKMLANWEEIARQMRRLSIVFIVSLDHVGPMMKQTTADDGDRVLMNFEQAKELHAIHPMKLLRICSETSAEFVPAVGRFLDIFPLELPMPPFKTEPGPDAD